MEQHDDWQAPGYLAIFRERWITVALCAALGVAAALLVALLLPPTYAASATLLHTVDSRDASLTDRSTFSLERVTSYPELAYSTDVLDDTIDDLGLESSRAELADRITVTNPSGTVLITIRAEAPSAAAAADLANTIAGNLSAVVSRLENSSRNAGVTVRLDLTNPATEPSTPSAPPRVLILGMGLLAGLALGLIAAILRARFDTRIRTVEQVRRVTGLPVLGQWSPHAHERRRLSLVRARQSDEVTAPSSRAETRSNERLAQQMRDTQLAVQQAGPAPMPQLLLLVPADSSAANARELVDLARSVAATGRRVCLVESAAPFGLSTLLPKGHKDQDLARLMASGGPIKNAALRVEGEKFSLLPAGDADAVDETAAEQRMPQLSAHLRQEFDTAIIEATSLTRPLSLQLVAPHADATLVLAHHGTTREADISHVLARLRLLGVRPLGVVMTGVPARATIDLVATWLPSDFATAWSGRSVEATPAGPEHTEH